VYNEEKVIKAKIENMLQLNYPKENLEIIVVDGNSKDHTGDIVNSFSKDGVRLIKETTRGGNTGAVKTGVSSSKGDIVVMSDAEALFDLDAIKLLVETFEDPSIGVVSGGQVLVNPNSNTVTEMEGTYSSFHEKMAIAEGNIQSTFHTKGELLAFRKEVFPFDAPNFKGSIDIDIAFQAVRKGLRAVYDDKVIFHDISPDRLSDRNRQKMQRGTLLQESVLQNLDMLFNRSFKKFGTLIAPSNFFIYILFPVVFLIGLIATPFGLIDLYFYSPLATYVVLIGLLLIFIIKKSRIFVFSFVHAQFMLLIGLVRIGITGKPKFTKQVEGTRKIASQGQLKP
jgi:cellulose synthase/poly-beta-1,6-N-acetylglucosamine synthase-like glycosyltransferase